MIDFWARIDESDVEKYAKTLILPEYMSHLKLLPFSLSEQVESASGREPLTLTYVGDGRLEELTLEPERDAAPLIASLDLGVNVEKIRIASAGPCWTWNDFGPSHPFYARPLDSTPSAAETNDAESRRFLRVYFEPKEERFRQELKFDACDAYVSVSRREIFFSWRVLRAYLEARCLDLLAGAGDDANENSALDDATQAAVEEALASTSETDAKVDDAESPAERPFRVDFAWDENFRPFDADYDASRAAPGDAKNEIAETPTPCRFKPCAQNVDVAPERRRAENAPKTPSNPPTFDFEVDDQSARFRFGKIAGSLVAANGETFEDAIRFAGLRRSLTRLADYVCYDPQNAAPVLDETGVRLRLTPVADNATSENDDV
ncbi:MAG: hypothetical protein IKU86_07070 [Thermoguttaceae bacterium]|nr:hypothetical protein [Thermoguttaceae bacterium]